MQRFLEPRSVVLVGTSRRTGSGAYNNLEVLLRFGYTGEIFVVNPTAGEILGRPTHAAVADLPTTPDLAVLSVGRDRVPAVFEQCVAKGIRRVVVISQGFADADDEGRRLQRELVDTARRTGTRVLGPNTMGLYNAFAGFTTAFLDTPRADPPPPLALVAQSGVLQVGPESWCGTVGKAIDVGNTSDVDFVDALEYLEHDPQTRVIALYLEGMPRGRRFLEVASRVARRKPIVALKSGRSSAGARAVASHTGSLVGEDAVFDAVLRRAGVVRVRTISELRAAGLALQRFAAPAGPRLAVVTATGAGGILVADACEDHGLTLAPLSPAVREALAVDRMAWYPVSNPADVWPLVMATGDFTGYLARAFGAFLRDDAVDAALGIVVCMDSPLHRDHDLVATARAISAANPHGKPVALWLYGSGAVAGAAAVNAAEIPNVACFETFDLGVAALGALHRVALLRAEAEESAATPTGRPALRTAAGSAVEGTRPSDSPASPPEPLPPGQVLLGAAAERVLARYGIPVAASRLVDGADGAAAAAAELGYPVVLKLVSPQWVHKSDRGGVALDLRDEAAVRSACEALRARFADATPRGTLDGFLVQRQGAGLELLCGIKRDPQFGPVVAVGMGGIHAEIFRDTAHEPAPVTVADALRMLDRLRLAPLLRGARGRPPVDRTAVAAVLEALGRLALDHPDVAELDLNPLLAGPTGCLAVDARIVRG